MKGLEGQKLGCIIPISAYISLLFISRFRLMRAFLTFLVFFSLHAHSQNAEIVVGKSYYGSTINEKEICDLVAFTTRPEVTQAVENIVRRSGLKQNFYVLEER